MNIQNRSPFRQRSRANYRIEAKGGQSEATVYLYDEIGFWGITADAFVKDLNKINAETINLRVNSPGGSVFDGTSIFNALRQHKSRVIAHIDGLAASIASVITMAADEIQMAENAFLMIHEPWSMVVGNADHLRQEASLLDKVSGTIAKTYMDRSGKDANEIASMMQDETWLTAQEALDAGFIDKIYEGKLDKAEVALFDLSVFAKAPAQLQPGKDLTAREIEQILRGGGCSQRQAKAILAAGFSGLQRDVASHDGQPEASAESQRDVEVKQGQPADAQRDVAVSERPKDRTSQLLIRAEKTAPSTA